MVQSSSKFMEREEGVKKMRYLVSSCLAGVACRYNGKASLDERIRELVTQVNPTSKQRIA